MNALWVLGNFCKYFAICHSRCKNNSTLKQHMSSVVLNQGWPAGYPLPWMTCHFVFAGCREGNLSLRKQAKCFCKAHGAIMTSRYLHMWSILIPVFLRYDPSTPAVCGQWRTAFDTPLITIHDDWEGGRGPRGRYERKGLGRGSWEWGRKSIDMKSKIQTFRWWSTLMKYLWEVRTGQIEGLGKYTLGHFAMTFPDFNVLLR